MFRIIWLQEAIDGLAAAYIAAGKVGRSQAVTEASAEVERLLDRDPTMAGESRGENLRLLIELPLRVEYELFPEQMTAVVKVVRYVPPKRREIV